VTNKRDRDLERAKAQRQAERQTKESVTRRQRWLLGAGAAVLALLVVGAVALAMDDNTEAETGASPTPGATSTATNGAEDIDCAKPGELQTEAQQFPNGPQGVSAGNFSSESTVGLKVETNCGELEIQLTRDAPRNLEALVFLANTGAPICVPEGADCSDGSKNPGTIEQVQGYWDNTTCHRLTTDGIFVIQCGDPTGTGTGGPGFTTPDEALDSLSQRFEETGDGRVVYPRGTVAMANSGPNTNGSQFFLVYDDSPLPPAYTVVGSVTKGLEIVDAVATQGSTPDRDGKPNQTLELEKVLSFERRPIQ
jgi:peptidyl-prolyl cis-trans isomerase B (cyclophilin B)